MSKVPFQPDDPGPLTVEAARVIGDLRIMHAKVDELHEVVNALRERHSHAEIFTYAERELLDQDIARADEIYLFFLALKEKLAR